MSLVIATNQDQDGTTRQEQSIYSAWSFRNSLSSVYKIPPNSQVALQSAKINLDGRTTLTRNNSWYYDYFGALLDLNIGGEPKIDQTTSYPKLQSLELDKDEILELTTDEVAARIEDKHREYHPNLKENFKCEVLRNSGLDFLGYKFSYDQNASQNYATMPATTDFKKWHSKHQPPRYVPSLVGTDIKITRDTGERVDPAVAIGLNKPLSLSNGSMRVDIQQAQTDGVAWGCGLSRDCPKPELNFYDAFAPAYFDPYSLLGDYEALDTGEADYFEDFGVHRNDSGELVVRHSVPDPIGTSQVMKEVIYGGTSGSEFPAGRYDMATNASGITHIRLEVIGEMVSAIAEGDDGKGGSEDFVICSYKVGANKIDHYKPVAQTCWCLHPVLFIGHTTAAQTSSISLTSFSGIPLVDYESRTLNKSGWFEQACLLSSAADGSGGSGNFKAIARCEEVDLRKIFDPEDDTVPYQQVGINASKGIDHKQVMILTPNETYYPTYGASMADLLGFPGRSLLTQPADVDGNLVSFISHNPPALNSLLSVFVRLNGFGQQVMNARTGNKSTILSHLPTADSNVGAGSSQRIFYEPQNFVWLDLKNPYEIQTSEFSIDFVYSNEQYAKILQGQSIVCLYFREKPDDLGTATTSRGE